MLVLSYPKKNSALFAGIRNFRLSAVGMLLILILLSGMASAQAPSVVINPTGGETGGDLKITITDSSVMVRRNGVDQFSLDPAKPRYDRGGLRTSVVFERKMGILEPKVATYLRACNISDVMGDGSAGNPWRVVTQTTFKSGGNADYNLSTEYVYTAGKSYYLINYYLSTNEGLPNASGGGPYWVHFYLSEAAWMNGETCGTGFKGLDVDAQLNDYLEAGSITGFTPRMVGVTKSGADCPSGLSGTHVFKTTEQGFASYYAGPVADRDLKAGNGFPFSNTIKTVPDNSGIAVHTVLEMFNSDMAGEISHDTRQIAVGFDATEMAALYMMDPNLEVTWANMMMETADLSLNPAPTADVAEGDAVHPISGLFLNVANASFNLPQVLEIQVTPSGAHPAVPNVDYRVLYNKLVILPGTYVNEQLPLPIEIIGNTTQSAFDKSFTVSLVAPTCAPHLQLAASNTSTQYTIIDDDENKIFIEPEKTTIKEGEKTKVKVRMTGVPLMTPLTVNLNRLGASTAETTDYSGMPAQVTIPANLLETEFELTAVGDLVLETNEQLDIEASTNIGGDPKVHTTAITITDTTSLNPDNRIITFAVPQGAEGTTVTMTASLPAGVTTEDPLLITINEVNPANTAEQGDLNTVFPVSLTIPANGHDITYNIDLLDDGALEDQEFWYFDAAASDTYGAFSVIPSNLDILDNPAGRIFTIAFAAASIDEGTGAKSIDGTISLPPGVFFNSPFTLNLVLDASSTADQNDFNTTLPLSVTFTAGANSMPFTVMLKGDGVILESNETLVLTGNVSGFTFVNGSILINDFTSKTASNKQIVLEPATLPSITEGQKTQMRARLRTLALRSQEPVVVNLAAGGGSAVIAGDYILPASVTIPVGQNGVTFDVEAVTDAITEIPEVLDVVASSTILGTTSSATQSVTITDAASTKIIFTVGDLVMLEGQPARTVTAALESGNATADINITLQTGSGSTAGDDDYVVLPSSVTIVNGTPSITFTIAATDDDLLERTETLILEGVASGYTVEGLTFTINDLTSTIPANKLITVAPDATSVNEGSSVRVWVRLPAGIKTSEEITITLGQGSGSDAGIQASDYEYALPVKIPAGAGEIDFMLQAETDNVLEPTEKLEISASATVFDDPAAAAGTVNIIDQSKTPANTALLVTGPASVTEGANVKWRVSLPSGVTTDIPINISLSPATGNTTFDADFNGGHPLTAVITPGATFVDVTFDAKADAIVEGPEHVQMLLQATDFTFSQEISLDVVDTNPAGLLIQLTANPLTVTEGVSTEITAALQGFTSMSDIDVVLSSGGTSTAGTDDHGALGTIHIAAGQSSAKVSILAAADDILEVNELLELRGSAAGYTVQGTDITITDVTGTNANKTIILTPVTGTVAEGGLIKVKASLPSGITSSQAITVTLSKAAGSSATLDVADVTFPTTVTIPVGAEEIEFDVTAGTDNLIEPSELLKLASSATVFGYTSTDVADITITDVSNKTITVTGPATIAEGATGTYRFSLPTGVTSTSAITITLTRDAASIAALTDLQSLPAVVIPAGDGFVDVNFIPADDNVIEATEKLILTPAATGFTFSQPISFDITDQDLAGATVTLSAAPASVAEGASSVITATLNGGVTSATNLTVTLSKHASSTAGNTEHGALGSITINAGQTTGTITLTTNTDQLLEASETVIVNGANALSIPVTGATVTITDASGPADITLSPVTATVAESGLVKIKASLPSGITSSQAITITLSKAAGSSATLDVADVTFPATVTIPAGTSEIEFDITAASDNVIEPAELLKLSSSATIFGYTSTDEADVTITDGTNKTITVTGPATIAESATGTYRFSLPTGVTSTSAITITLTRDAASTAALTDLQSLPTVVIPAGDGFVDVNFIPADDNVIEATEKLILTPAATGFTFNQPISFDITDQDLAGATITLSAAPASVAEGASSVITATLNGGVTAASNLVITLTKGAGSTAGNTEHGALGPITINAGQTTGTVTLTTNTDQVLEANETVMIEGANAQGIVVTGTTVTITDATGTNANKTIILTPVTGTVAEGGLIKIKASLPSGITSSQAITITLSKAAGSSATLDVADVTFPATVTIPVGAEEIEFDVTAGTDNLIEPSELLKLASSATVFGYTSTDAADITITDVSNKTITVTGPATIAESATGTYRFSLPTGVTSTSAITITLTRDAASTAVLADIQSLPAVVIPAGNAFVDVDLKPEDDDLLEALEKLILTPTATGFTFNQPVSFDITDQDLAGASITLSAAPATVAEGTSTVITATLNGGITSVNNLTVTLSKNPGSTAGNSEHGALGTITINAGQATGSFTLSTNADQLLETGETIVVDGINTQGITVTGTTVNLTDGTGPADIALTPATATVAEGGTIKLKASLPAGITATQAVTVALSKGSGSSAALGATEVSFPASVTIPAGATEIEFDVTATTDNVIETAELLELTANATILGHASTASSDVTITDVSLKAITITGPSTVTEGNQAVYTFALPTGVTAASDIVIQLTQGAATPAVNAADIAGGIPAAVTIPAGSSSGSLTLNINTDAVIEPVEKLALNASLTGYTFSGSILLDVQDANFGGAISFTSSHATIREGSGTAIITVSLPGALTATADIQVDITKDALSTAANSDHVALPATVTIPAGQHSATFNITAPADNILELPETLQLGGTAPGFSVNGITISIEDATGLDPLNTVISLVPDGSSIAENATGDFSVKLPDGIVSSTPITVTMSKTAAASTAADTDHTQIPVSITIPAMTNSSADFDISAVKDGIIEPLETIRVDGAAAGFTFSGANIRITDLTGLDPANRQISIAIDSTTLHEGSTSKVVLSLPAGITTALPIAINLAADAAFNAANADFSVAPAAVIAKDQQKVTISLTAVQDNIIEANEILRLTGIATGFTVTPSAQVNIPGDPAPVLNITVVKTADAAEPNTNGAFSIRLTGAATAPYDVTVRYTLSGTAVPGQDFAALTGTAVIKAGASSVAVPVAVTDDQVVEGTETVQILLTSGSFVYFGNTVSTTLDAVKSAALNITDNETTADRSILVEKIADATEPSTAGSIRVRFANTQLTAAVPVTVTYTVGGTATANTDYNALPGTVTIPAGSKEAVISIAPKDDNLLEGTESVNIQLTAATASLPAITWPVSTTQHTASMNLYDNDVITVEIFTAAQANEGAGLIVTLRASQAPSADMPVTVSLQHDGLRSVTTTVPRTGANLAVTIPAGQTEVSFTLNLTDNDTNDDNGFVNLAIQPYSGPGQAYGKGSSSNTATAVTDNDALEISFSKDTAKVQEGNTGVEIMPFKITLSRQSTRTIVLEYEFADAFEGAGADKDPQRARAGEDFQDHIQQIIIPALATEAEIEVPVPGDIVHESDEYFAVKLKAATVASGQQPPVLGTVRTAVGSILNDDQVPDFEIRVQKGLSPNGDGKNDVLIIENIEKYSRNEIVIVNRWGGTIYSTSNYHNQSNNFNGQSNKGSGAGKLLPDGSYFYVLHVWDANGNMTRHTGYIVLKSAQ